jgi:hypothetical protein
MDEMIAADSRTIAVPHNIDYREFRVRQLDAGGKSQGPAVSGMDSASIYITRHPAGTTYPGGDHRLFLCFP